MFKKKKGNDLHTKDWTLNRIWGLLGLLGLEVFCVVWLILFEQQVIVSILFMAFAVGSMVGIIKLARDYKRGNFKTLLEKDIEEDQKYAEKYGDAYYMWKAYTLPNIVEKGTKNVKMQLDDKDKVIIERGKQIALLEKALELACETYWNDCGMEDCPDDIMDGFSDKYKKCKACPNGGDRFVNDKGCCWVDYFKTKAKEMMKSE